MDNNKLKKYMIVSGLFLAPWIYYFTVRPKLVHLEKRFDQRMTDISDKELLLMKKKALNKEDKKE